MFKTLAAAALGALALAAPTQAAARELPPRAISASAECWVGPVPHHEDVTAIVCRDAGRLYHCRVARTECWPVIPPGPYTRGLPGQFRAPSEAVSGGLSVRR